MALPLLLSSSMVYLWLAGWLFASLLFVVEEAFVLGVNSGARMKTTRSIDRPPRRMYQYQLLVSSWVDVTGWADSPGRLVCEQTDGGSRERVGPTEFLTVLFP